MAVTAGIGPLEYWELTYTDITIVINAYNDSYKVERQQEAINTYILADLIGQSVARLMDDKAKYPQLHEVYPNLFEAPTRESTKQQDWHLMKDRMLAFAEGRKDELDRKKKGVRNESRDS